MEDPAEKTPEVIYIEKSGVRICDANILADLCEEAGRKSTEIRDCLNTYKLNTPTKQLKCMFSQFKKPIIVDTLKFLNATDHNWDDYVKEACVHELICRVQNLLIDQCQFCDQHYATCKSDGSLLQFSLCGQEVHEKCLKKLLGERYTKTLTTEQVEKLINPFNIISLKFMCLKCSCATLPQTSDGLKKSVAKKSNTPHSEEVAAEANGNDGHHALLSD